MHFTGGINRPPYETADGFLQVTEGCSHNTCLFCTYFKEVRYHRCSIEQIEADVMEIPAMFGSPERIFLQGADGFSADYDTLMRTAEMLHEHVPSVKTIGGYARVDSFFDKTAEQLRSMAEAGFDNPYIGVESGRDATLKSMNKGYTAAQAREQLEKLDEAGFPYVVNYLCGAAGHGNGAENARATAVLYDSLRPTMVNMSMLTVVPGTPLARMVEKGRFEEETEIEKLEETLELLANLTNETVFMNEHASNTFHLQCRIPEQRDEVLAYVHGLIANSDRDRLGAYRKMIVRAF